MLRAGFVLEPGGELFSACICLSHSRRSNCKHVVMTQKYRWRRVEYSFIFHANLLKLLFRSVNIGEQIGISNLILKQTDSRFTLVRALSLTVLGRTQIEVILNGCVLGRILDLSERKEPKNCENYVRRCLIIYVLYPVQLLLVNEA